MSETHQRNVHGDNVGRDKVTHVKIPFKPLLFLILSGLVIFWGYTNQDKIKHHLGWDKVFKIDDTRFKILIVPFKVMCDYNRNKDIGLHINERLFELNLKDSLNIYPYYLNLAISDNFNSDSAKYLLKHHNADQIIYGSYFDQDCSGTTGDEICYNWYTDEKWDIDSLHRENLLTSSNYKIATTQDLREGEIQESTDYIIYWIAGLNAFNQNKYSKASKHWSYIYDTLNIANSTILEKLGTVALILAKYQSAFNYLNESLTLSQNPKDSAITYNNLAIAYQDLGNYKQAKRLLTKALQLDTQNFGKNHPNTLVSLSNLGVAHRYLGEYEEAINLLQLVLQLNIQNFGKDHPNTAESRSNLANVYTVIGNSKKARELLEITLQWTISKLGEDHPNTATSRSNLALVYRDLGNYEDARALLILALQSNIDNFGAKHPETLKVASNLALVCIDLKDYESARKILEFTLQSAINKFGEDHPDVALRLSNLAVVYQHLGNYKQARDLLEAALRSNVNYLGEDHNNTVASRSNLATVYTELGDYEQARDLLEATLRSDIRNSGANSINTAISRSNLATVYAELGNYEQAKELFQKAYSGFEKILGEDDPRTQNVKERLDSMN